MKRKIALVLVLTILFNLISGAVLAGNLEQTSDFSTPRLVVNVSYPNVRSGPGIQYGVVAVVTGGTELPVLATAGDNVWYQVTTNSKVGWVNVSFTLARGDFSRVGLANQPTTSTQAPASVTGNHVVINTGVLNVRSGPGAEYSVVAKFRGGTELSVIGHTADNAWLLVEGQFGRGWLNSAFVLFRGDYASVPTVDAPTLSSGTTPVTTTSTVAGPRIVVNTGALNVRTGPGPEFSVVTTFNGGVTLPVVGRNSDGSWYVVEGSFRRGWVSSQFVVFRGNYRAVPIVDVRS